jgi:hypothetical protein
MKALCVPVFVILAVVSAVMPLSAHHSWPVSNDRLVTVKGKVIEFKWANPHPMIILEVQTNDGQTEKWQIGGPAIIRMASHDLRRTRAPVSRRRRLTGTDSVFARPRERRDD